MQKADPLIHTKLRLPFIRPGLVSRPRLQARIAEGLCCPLTLITAPAGFGKTTLAVTGVAGCGVSVAWLSLDKNDNQAERFLTYLVAALQEADSAIGKEAAQHLAAPQQASSEAILTSLINDLDSAARDMVLVLDDYQFIHSQSVHEAAAFLLEHCPKSLHLLIATRSDPPLPLARLRARGQMVELRAADLRFSEAEAAQFLNEVMGLHLDAGSVTALEERTEGWIAGLQMAALTMRDHRDVAGFIQGFSGTNRYILDYLLEEVLASQPAEIQHFLLHTSILDRLTAPLCEAVLEADQSESWSVEKLSVSFQAYDVHNCQAILKHLERANLFLAPLDDERQWYRYHHLFADLLRARLDQLYPGFAQSCHANAAAWLEREGMMVEAVNHTLAAGEYDRAARLVEENTTRLLAQGELNALMGWIEVLPAELRLSRPWLCIHQAYALRLAGRSAEVASLLEQAEAALRAESAQDLTTRTGQAGKSDAFSMDVAEARALEGAIAAVRAFTTVITGQEAEAISLAQQAMELLPPEDLWNRSSASWALGFALHSHGHFAKARAAFEEMVRLGKVMGNIWTVVNGLADLALVVRDQGDFTQARAFLEEALSEASRKGARDLGYVARAEEHLAYVLYEQNELEAAQRLLSDALTHIRFWPNPNYLAMAHVCQARVLLAQGDLQGARIAICEANQLRRTYRLTRWIRRMIEAELVRVWFTLQASGASLIPGDPLAEQSSAFIASWQSECRFAYKGRYADPRSAESEDILMDECTEIAGLSLARVLLASGQPEETLLLLERLTQRVRTAGHINGVIRSLVITALARQASPAWQGKSAGRPREVGSMVSALADFEEALSLAKGGGFVRVFLDEGQPMEALLTQWLVLADPGPLRDYAVHLLSQLTAEQQMILAAQAKVSPVGGPSAGSGQSLIEPLSQRELEVLHLIALGKTNKEIAEQLIVAVGTVKAHAASIYRKLEAANRTEAVSRARQLGIFP